MTFRQGSNRQLPEHLFEIANSAVVSTYDSHQKAQHAVDVLADEGFDVKNLAIMGNGLTTVERVTGKLSYGKVALTGVFSGLYFGAGICIVAVLLGMAENGSITNLLAACLLSGIGFGVLISVVGYALNRNRRSYTAIGGLKAQRYDLLAPRQHVAQIRQILAQHARDGH